ncbi:MAG: hypothetical protein WD004_01420 [Actinomycetota bacterium]
MQSEIKVSDPRAEAILTAYHQVVVERLDEGIQEIQEKALEAMREIAIEIWRTSGAQGDDLQTRIMSALSKDDALKGLIQHSDERFQSLSLRTQHIEDSLLAMSNATRELRSLIVSGGGGSAQVDTDAVAGAVSGAVAQSTDALQARVDQIEEHLSAAFVHLAERDHVFLDSVKTQVAGEAGKAALAAQATVEKVDSIEQQLRTGASAMGSLVKVVQDEVGHLSEIAGRELDIDPGMITAAIDDRVARLATLFRSDSRRLAELIQERAATGQPIDVDAIKAVVAETLDQRLGRMSELVSATTMSAVNEVARNVPEQAAEALSERIDDVIGAIDRNFVGLADMTETEMHRMGRFVADRTADKIDAQVTERMDGAVERLTKAATMVAASGGGDATDNAEGLSEAAVADLAAIMDQRIMGLAKMLRSDNQAMAEIIQVAAEQQAAKQAARSTMELAANLPQQIMETLDRRFAEFAESLHAETQSTVVAVAKTADVLAQRIDQTAAAVAQRNDREMQAMNEKFGKAVHELAKEIR